ncbi:hypothetical protein B0H66DRAFT_644434 [Apodospora peruviana]|uniref:Uncharacterized protein n=1 Tax=Apodospora peruviana TaxID=516989 RepID=A0AAE0HT39_9PEZI|nr:hypothetical protein B0H66DRAFT_644434 [Apodospora peruviana]
MAVSRSHVLVSVVSHNSITSPQHDKNRRPKLWTALSLRQWTLATFILFFILLLIAFAILFAISNRDHGLATANPSWYYLWVYGPTAAFTLIAAFWGPVEFRAKQMQPWVLMSDTFRSAQESLLLDYIDRLSFVGLFVSLRRQHWLAFCGIAAGFAIIAATVASSGLFVSSSLLVQRDDVPLMATEAFSAGKMPRAGSRPAMNVYGALDSHIPFPAGTVDQYAFQGFVSSDGIAYDGLTTLVDVFEAVLDCEVATVAPSDQAEPGENTLPESPTQTYDGGLSTAVYLESNLILKTPSCPNPLYLSVIGPKHFAFNGSACGGDTDATVGIDRFVAIWGDWDTPGDEAEFFPSLGLVCVPSYSIRKGSVTLNKDNTPSVAFPENGTTSLDGITAWDVLTEFVRTTVESTDSIFQGEYGSIGGKYGTGLEYLTETVIIKGRAGDRKAALERLFGLVTAQVANQYLKEAAQVSLVGTTEVRESRLVVSPVSFWVLEAMLLILSLLAGYLILISPKIGTSCDTSTLAGLSAVLARSAPALSMIEGAGGANTKFLAAKLKNVEFKTDVSFENNKPVFRIESIEQPASPLSPKPLPGSDEGRYQPFTVTITGRILLLAASPALIVTLELLYQLSSRNNGLADINAISNVAHYAWTYTPTAVMVGMGLWLAALSSTVKLLGPYHSLWKGRASAEDALTENYVRPIAVVAVWNATRKKKWGVVAVGLASMLAPFLTIVASGLLFTGPSVTRTAAAFQRVDSFNLSTASLASLGTGLTFANLALASNLSDPLWVYQDLVFPKLINLNHTVLTTRSTTENISNATTIVTFSELPAVRSTFNCTPATPAHLACANGRRFVGSVGQSLLDGPPASETFAGTGYFGTTKPLRPDLFLEPSEFPLCPPMLVAFGHATDFTIDDTWQLACSPYVEEILVSATFRLPSWELDSPPVVINQTERSNILPGMFTDEFLRDFSLMVFSNPAGLDPSFDLGGLFGLAISGRNGTPVAELAGNIGNLQRAVEGTFGVIMAQFLNNARTNTTLDGGSLTTTITSPNIGQMRLHQSKISTRILEALLGIMFVCVVVAYSAQRHMGKLLPKEPCSIAAQASLLAGSDLLRYIPPGAEWMTDQERNRLDIFRRALFGLGSWASRRSSSSGEQEVENEGAKWFGIDFLCDYGRGGSLS